MSRKRIFGIIISIIFALTLWQILAMILDLKILLVSPIAVGRRLLTIWKESGFLTSIGFTLFHIAAGFLLGLILGIVFASLAYKYSWVEIALLPWMATIKSVPVASFVVICLIWLSAESLSIFISFLIVVPIVYQNTLTALRLIDINLIDLSKLENMSYIKKLQTIYLPHISASLVSTAEVTAAMAWKAGVAAEIIGTPKGSIGKELYFAKIYLDTDDLLAWTVIIVLVSVAFEKLFVFILRNILGEKD